MPHFVFVEFRPRWEGVLKACQRYGVLQYNESRVMCFMVRKKGDLDRMDTDLLKHGCRLNRNTKLPPGMREQKCSSGDVRYHVVGNDNTRDTVYMFMSEDGTVGLDFCKPSKDPIQREAHEMLMFFGAMGIVQGTATSLLQLCKNLGVKQPEGHVIWIELSRLVLLNRCMFMWSMDMEDVLVTEERKNRSLVSEGGNNEIRRAVDKYFGILTRPVLFANDRRMRCVEDLTETNGTVNMRLEAGPTYPQPLTDIVIRACPASFSDEVAKAISHGCEKFEW